MRTSLRICYNKQRVDTNKEATVYIRVIINQVKREIPTGIRWSIDKVDWKVGVLKPRFNNDQECEDNNIILRRELGKCNEIFRYYRLADTDLTISRFIKDYNNHYSKSNFVNYMEVKIKERFRNKEITGETKKKHEVTFRKLKKFNPNLLFADFDERWCQNFDNWLKRHIKSQKVKHSQNTRWSYHKVIKTYMNQAKRDKIRFVYAYEWFSLAPVKGNWSAIYENEVIKLYDYYSQNLGKRCPHNHRKILRAFLFGCMTGLRISDIKRITPFNVMENILVFVPYKTRKTNYMHRIPLNKMAKKLFNDAKNEALKDQIFNCFAEQYANRTLKNIAEVVEIDKNLHWHVARHTFISLYYAKTKDLLATKNFAGHKSVNQTMVYTHQNPDEIIEKMKPMDDII